MTQPSESRSVLLGLAAVGAGVGNNAFVKLLPGLPSAELAALRACGAVILFLPLFWRGGLPRLSPAMLLRAAAEGAATILLLLSLSMTSLSLVTTIMMGLPIGVMAVGWFLDGERVSRRSGVFLLLGFAGAALASGPALAGNVTGVLAVLASAGCYVLRDIITRVRLPDARSLDLSFTANSATLLMALGLGLGLPRGWVMPLPGDAPILAAMLALYIASNLLIATATRGGRASLIAATRYSAVLWAIALDMILLQSLPPPMTLLGAALVVVCGLGLATGARPGTMS